MNRGWGRGRGGVNLFKLKGLGSYVGRRVSLVGVVVVVEVTIPRPSLGTDCVAFLKIIDQLQVNPEAFVNMFAPSVDSLPHVRSSKDIIVLSAVQLCRLKSGGRGPAVDFNEKFSTFALFDRKDEDNTAPYQASPAFVPLDTYNNSIRQFRYLSLSFPFDVGISTYAVRIEDMKVDFFCYSMQGIHAFLILHVCDAEDMWAMFIWDGTDAPALSLKSKLGEENNQLALCIERKPLHVDVVSGFPCVGTVLRVMAAKSFGNIKDYFLSNCSWVRIRNMLLDQQASGLWMGTLTEKTKFRLLSENDHCVRERIRICEERIEESRRPSSSRYTSDFLTVTNHWDVCYSTLMDLLTLPQEVFFEDYPTLDVLSLRMNKLFGVAEGPLRNPPWTEVCLELHPPIEGDPSGRKQFHICDTTFAPES